MMRIKETKSLEMLDLRHKSTQLLRLFSSASEIISRFLESISTDENLFKNYLFHTSSAFQKNITQIIVFLDNELNPKVVGTKPAAHYLNIPLYAETLFFLESCLKTTAEHFPEQHSCLGNISQQLPQIKQLRQQIATISAEHKSNHRYMFRQDLELFINSISKEKINLPRKYSTLTKNIKSMTSSLNKLQFLRDPEAISDFVTHSKLMEKITQVMQTLTQSVDAELQELREITNKEPQSYENLEQLSRFTKSFSFYLCISADYLDKSKHSTPESKPQSKRKPDEKEIELVEMLGINDSAETPDSNKKTGSTEAAASTTSSYTEIELTEMSPSPGHSSPSAEEHPPQENKRIQSHHVLYLNQLTQVDILKRKISAAQHPQFDDDLHPLPTKARKSFLDLHRHINQVKRGSIKTIATEIDKKDVTITENHLSEIDVFVINCFAALSIPVPPNTSSLSELTIYQQYLKILFVDENILKYIIKAIGFYLQERYQYQYQAIQTGHGDHIDLSLRSSFYSCLPKLLNHVVRRLPIGSNLNLILVQAGIIDYRIDLSDPDKISAMRSSDIVMEDAKRLFEIAYKLKCQTEALPPQTASVSDCAQPEQTPEQDRDTIRPNLTASVHAPLPPALPPQSSTLTLNPSPQITSVKPGQAEEEEKEEEQQEPHKTKQKEQETKRKDTEVAAHPAQKETTRKTLAETVIPLAYNYLKTKLVTEVRGHTFPKIAESLMVKYPSYITQNTMSDTKELSTTEKVLGNTTRLIMKLEHGSLDDNLLIAIYNLINMQINPKFQEKDLTDFSADIKQLNTTLMLEHEITQQQADNELQEPHKTEQHKQKKERKGIPDIISHYIQRLIPLQQTRKLGGDLDENNYSQLVYILSYEFLRAKWVKPEADGTHSFESTADKLKQKLNEDYHITPDGIGLQTTSKLGCVARLFESANKLLHEKNMNADTTLDTLCDTVVEIYKGMSPQ